VDTTTETPTDDSGDAKPAGMEPEKFRKRLFAVSAAVLMLGIFGGTCLGSKIENAESAQAETSQQTPSSSSPTDKSQP
jgi:hypothetical protein